MPLLVNTASLSLSFNRMTGSIPEFLTEFFSLQKLHLDSNYLNGTVPVGLSEINPLVEVRLDDNDLSGVIEDSLCQRKTILTADCDEVSCTCCTACG